MRIGKALWPPQPARVVCCEIVFETKRLTMSRAMMPRTPPDAFCNAVMRPMRVACNTSTGISPRTRCSPTWQNNSVSLMLSKMGLTCSAVMPHSPPAAPRLAHFKFFANRSVHIDALVPRPSREKHVRGPVQHWCRCLGKTKRQRSSAYKTPENLETLCHHHNC